MTKQQSSSHTPGPWRVQHEYKNRPGRQWRAIDEGFFPLTRYMDEANSRLIAAAPEMLDTLKDAVSSYWRVRDEDEDALDALIAVCERATTVIQAIQEEGN